MFQALRPNQGTTLPSFLYAGDVAANEKNLKADEYDGSRTVPTVVTVDKFCASQDTRVSCGWCLLMQGYFCVV